jgi:Ca2+:H+ antiporter
VRRTLVVCAAVAAVCADAGALHYAGVSPTAVFLVSGAALGGLAWLIGLATESVAARFGPAVTGVLQTTLGNLPELFIVLFALSAGETVVAQTSILGSLFANALLVLGLTIVAGARGFGGEVMRFRRRLPNDTATLLLLAI